MSRTKNSNTGRPRGKAAPRGKRTSTPEDVQVGLPHRPQPPGTIAAGPELIEALPEVVLPHPDEATIMASAVSTAALRAATQEGAPSTVEMTLPAELSLGEEPGQAEASAGTARAHAGENTLPQAPAMTAPAMTAATSGAHPTQSRKTLDKSRLVSSSNETQASPSPDPTRSSPFVHSASALPASGGGADERGALPSQGGAEGIFGHVAARSAAIASLGLLDLNARMIALLQQQSEVSFSVIQAVLTARSVADAVRAQTDGVSRVLDLQATQWQEITRAVGRVVEDAAEPVRAASLWQAP